jgi:spermidine/putrescine transport system permease protein
MSKSVRAKRGMESSHTYHPSAALTVYVVLIFVLLYLPIISVVVFSFNASRSAVNWGGFSLKWYQQLFSNTTLLEDLFYTVTISFLATIISTLIGTLGAIGLGEYSKKAPHFTNLVLSVNNLPVVNPDIVTAVSLMALFIALESVMPMGYGTLLLAHIAFCTPYVVIQVYPKVLSQDPAEIEAALDLGATRRQAVMKIVLPDLMPAILSGAMLAFTMSFDDFIISYFVGGSIQNISVYVYSMKKFNPVVNALSSLIFLFIAVVVLVYQFLIGRHQRYEDEDLKDNKTR